MHFSGGACYNTGKNGQTCMGAGWPCCVSGDRAFAIKHSGWLTRDESAVTCPRCLAIMAKRVDPGPIGRGLGIPPRATP